MSGKVFGFKANDAKILRAKITGKTEIPVGYKILANKLVPVVSLEWLEKELENLDFYDFLDYHGNVWQEKIKEILLSAAKKAGG